MPQVIVAGGGPVGLLTAALLDATGVSVEVFEKKTEPSRHAKAVILHPRTLELLTLLRTVDGQRMTDVMCAEGKPLDRTHYAVLPQMLDYTGLGTPCPFVLMLPQDRTERLLADHLRARAVPVHYGQAVTGFEQSAHAVQVTVGSSVRDADYLIGADGAHSVVRRLAGVEFPGTPPSVVAFVADVSLTDPPATARHHWNPTAGSINVLPIPGGRQRVFGAEVSDTALTPGQARARRLEQLTVSELEDAAGRITGSRLGVERAHWLSRATDEARHASRYRVGRVLLAGDAAHIHLPAGGQGLNVGLQDAVNLAWKLAAEIQGWAGRPVVDGAHDYDSERRPVAERLVTDTLAQAALMYSFTPASAALRTLFNGFLTPGTHTHDELARWLSGLAVHYPATTTTTASATVAEGPDHLVGSRAPDLALQGGTLMRLLRCDRFLFLDLTTDQHFRHVSDSRVHKTAGRAGTGSWAKVTAALIRPDGYVAHATEDRDTHSVIAAIDAWTGRGSPDRRP